MLYEQCFVCFFFVTNVSLILDSFMSSQTTARKRGQYDPNRMAAAIELVRSGMGKAKAANLCQVPTTTLLDKLSGRVPEEPTRPGPRPIMSAAEERTLVDYAKLMAEIGTYVLVNYKR